MYSSSPPLPCAVCVKVPFFSSQSLSTVSGQQWLLSVDRIDNSRPHSADNFRLTAVELNPKDEGWTEQKVDELLELLDGPKEKTEWQRLRSTSTERVQWAKDVIFCCTRSAARRQEVQDRNAQERARRVAIDPTHPIPVHLTAYPGRGICDLSVTDVLDIMDGQSGRCAYSSVPLNLRLGGKRASSQSWRVSTERVDPQKGYTKDNVVFVAIEFNTTVHPWHTTSTSCSTGWTAEKFLDFSRGCRAERQLQRPP